VADPRGRAATGAAARQARWLRRIVPAEDARARLIAIPHAGGTASFFSPWRNLLPAGLELMAVQLPGRETRLMEPLERDIDVVVEELAEAVAALPNRPYALFGHSMGALIAYELARRLRSLALAEPDHLFISSCPAPHRYSLEAWAGYLDDDKLLQLLGLPPEITANAEFAELVLPIIRADTELCERYRYVQQHPLDCPITVCAGTDEMAHWSVYLRAWSEHTTAEFRALEWPGGHFYLRDHPAELIAVIDCALEAS
jgi:surfactin synthase thioesterase subunit